MAAQVPFALSPGSANLGIIDYSTRAGQNHYEKATRSFNGDISKYDLGTDGLLSFIKDLQQRCTEFDCNAPLSVPVNANGQYDPNGNLMHLTEHPALDVSAVHAHVMSYITIDDVDKQRDYLISMMILNSLTPEAKAIIRLREPTYTVQDNAGDIVSGPLLFRALYSCVSIDTSAEVKAIEAKIDELGTTIEEYDMNVQKFNDYVREINLRLAQRDAKSTSLLGKVFSAYEKVGDETFKRFVEKIEQGHLYENRPVTIEDLLSRTTTFYKDRKAGNKWDPIITSREDVIALKAENNLLRKQLSKPASNNKKLNKKFGANKKGANKAIKRDFPPWVDESPPQGGPHTKKYKETLYYWCDFHKKWSDNAGHTTGKCEAKKRAEAKGNSTASRVAHAHSVTLKKVKIEQE